MIKYLYRLLTSFLQGGSVMCTTKCRTYVELYAAHSGVTGSNFRMEIHLEDGRIIRGIIDLGVYQEKLYEHLNNQLIFNPSEIDFVLVTHCHVDHVARLPMLAKGDYKGKIYMTPDSSKLMPSVLNDSCKVLKTKARRKNINQLYDEKDVSETLKMIEAKDYGEAFMPHENVRVMFLRNGHLQGAAMILIRVYNVSETVNILFTGDYSKKNTFFSVGELPKWIKELPLTVICESTYGDTESSSVIRCYKKNIIKAAKEGYSIMSPAFSLGRTQELLYNYTQYQISGELDPSIPIYIDGKIGIGYTEMYRNGILAIDPKAKKFIPNNSHYVGNGIREDLLNSKKQKIIISSSGMGTYGPAQLYIPEFLPRKKMLIHFTGYCAEGTYGRRIMDTPQGEMVTSGENDSGVVAIKNCRVEFTSEFSAHAKADELEKFLKQFTNLHAIILNHGAPETKKRFAKRLYEKFEDTNIAIIGREVGFRIGRHGIIRTLNVDMR